MEKLCNVFVFESGETFTEIDRINYNESIYSVLVKDNSDDFCIKKIESRDGSELLMPINTKEEFDSVLKIFTNKHIN